MQNSSDFSGYENKTLKMYKAREAYEGVGRVIFLNFFSSLKG